MYKTKIKTTSGINIIAGLWILFSPYILGFSSVYAAVANNFIFGVLIGILAAMRVSMPDKSAWVSIVNLILGVWMILSPFALGFSNLMVPVWNNIILGAIVTGMAIWSASVSTRESHV